MMTTSVSKRLRVALGTALSGVLTLCLIVACGGEQSAGIQGSGSPVASGSTAQGPITGFGSIFIDGIEYTTTGAQVSVDGQSSTEAQLRVGYIVTVRGTVNADGRTGTATSVAFSQDLRGPITQIDTTANTFVVLGQTVRIVDNTLFDDTLQPADITSLQVNTAVQVSGFADASGAIVANRIEPSAAGAALQVRGVAKLLDTSARTFRIGTLLVNYGNVTVTGTLAENAVVSVQGSAVSAGGALIASRVDVSRGLGAAANDKGQVEGVITQFTSANDFVVDGQRITADTSTELVLRGTTLAINVPVKVRGTFNAGGVLAATRIEVKPQSSARVQGLVDSVNATNNTLTVLGVVVTTTSATTYNDKSDQKLKSFKLSDVRSGDYVEVRGAQGTGSTLSASIVERQRPDTRSSLRGVASNLAAPNFVVLGITVMTDTQTQFLGLGTPTQAPVAFFAQANGRIVKIRGTLTGNVFLADRVQIEP